LGLWIEQSEGAKFWLKVMTELKNRRSCNRGVCDVLVAVVDGPKGFPEAITTVFPETQVQTCIVHLIRNSLEFASWKDRKGLASELKSIYRAATAEAALAALEAFEAGPWGRKYPPVAAAWRRQWDQVIPFFAYPPEVRRIIYTTNAVESLHMQLRKIINRRSCKTRGHFPSDEAATKLPYLALRNITRNWTMPPRELKVVQWRAAMNQFAILFPERFEALA
jgi:transposase-like protein